MMSRVRMGMMSRVRMGMSYLGGRARSAHTTNTDTEEP